MRFYSQQFHRKLLDRCFQIIAAGLLFSCAALLASCSGSSSSSTSTSVTVTISPATTTLSAGQTSSFIATVTNTSNTAVTWKVNGVEGGNSTYGTITTSGVYYAPGTVTSTVTETITAVSTADTSASGSASVTLTTSTSSASTSVSVSPSFAVLAAGAQQTFAATTGGIAADVTWNLSCKATNATDCGTISSAGVYDAPLAPPPGGNVMLTATMKDGSANPGYSTITIQYSNGTLAGQYAFSFNGQNGTSPIAQLGSLTLDGAGNIASGVQDSAGSSSATISGGTYHIGTDGRGTATVQTSSGAMTWRLVVVDHSTVFASATDSSGGLLTGSLALQNPAQFDIGVISGNYTFSLRCPDGAQSSALLAQVGAVATDGAGHIAQGLQDVNTSSGAQAALGVTGSFSAPAASTGRGTLTLSSSFGTQNLIYYLVDNTHLKLMEESGVRAATGDAIKQTAGPFSVSNVKGKFATALYGWNASSPASFGGQFRLDGTGLTSGTVDSNVNGNVLSNVTTAGTYSVTDPAFGRTLISLTGNGKTYNLVAYPAANQDLYVAEIDGTAAAGPAYAQAGFVITTGSLAGSFGTSLTGSTFGSGSTFETATGQLVVNGGGAITATLDIASGSTLSSATALTASYFVDATGYVTVSYNTSVAAFSTGTLVVYPIDAQHFLSMEIDSNRVLTGFSEVHN